MNRFDDAFKIVVGFEGGYSNDPHDPGGETNFGISKRAYPHLQISTLTEDVAMQIYRRDYWDVVGCDRLPWPLALYVFDAAVNQGKHTAIVLLQRSTGVVQDGILGPVTMTAIERINQSVLEARYLARRAERYMQTQAFDRYGFGWLVRLFSIVQLGNHPVTMPQFTEGSKTV